MDTSIPQDAPKKQCTGPCQQWLPATLENFNRHLSGLHPRCKACRSAQRKYERETRPEVRDAERANSRAYSQLHKEERSTYNKAYRQENRDRILAYEWEYRQTHKEQDNARCTKYNQENREQLNARQREYSKGRPIENRLAHQRRRLREKTVPGSLTAEQIKTKLKAQKYRCYYAACGHAKFEKIKGKYIFQLDHTIPISREDAGPRHDVNFVVLACPTCNNKKKTKLPHEWGDGGRLV